MSQLVRTGILDRQICLVDTPGFFDTELGDEVHDEILKCVSMLNPGPHVILTVLEIGRQTHEVVSTVRKLQDTFGKQCTNHMVFVFTHKDKLYDDDEIKNIDEFVGGMKDDVQKLLRKCGNRYVAFDNKLAGTYEENKAQVANLFTIIDEMLKSNNHAFFSNEDLEDAMQELNANRIQKKREINHKLANLSDQFNQVISKANKTNKQLKKLELQEENQQKNREKLEAELGKKEKILREIMAERKENEKEIKKLKKERDEQKSEHSELDKKIKESYKKVQKLEKQFKTAETEKSNVEMQLKKKTEEKDLAESQRKMLEEELDKVKTEKNQIWSDVEELVETRAQAQIDFSEVLEELKKKQQTTFLTPITKLMENVQKNGCVIM